MVGISLRMLDIRIEAAIHHVYALVDHWTIAGQNKLSFSPDTRLLSTSNVFFFKQSGDGRAVIWDTRMWKVMARWQARHAQFCFGSRPNTVVSVHKLPPQHQHRFLFKLWSADTGPNHSLATLPVMEDVNRIGGIAGSEDGKTLVTARGSLLRFSNLDSL